MGWPYDTTIATRLAASILSNSAPALVTAAKVTIMKHAPIRSAAWLHDSAALLYRLALVASVRSHSTAQKLVSSYFESVTTVDADALAHGCDAGAASTLSFNAMVATYQTDHSKDLCSLFVRMALAMLKHNFLWVPNDRVAELALKQAFAFDDDRWHAIKTLGAPSREELVAGSV